MHKVISERNSCECGLDVVPDDKNLGSTRATPEFITNIIESKFSCGRAVNFMLQLVNFVENRGNGIFIWDVVLRSKIKVNI